MPSDFVNFESPQGQPIGLSPDGSRVYAVNTPDNRLSVFEAGTLRLLGEVPVGLEPVSVAARPGSAEVWVVNRLSDGLSVLAGDPLVVVATIALGDEPQTLAFTPDGSKAYVSISGEGRVAVVDPARRRVIRSVELPGHSPRALAMSPDGTTVWAAPYESGNQTRGSRNLSRSSIVRDPSLPDHDVFAIRTADDTITGMADGIGTLITALRAEPNGTRLWAAHLDAHNMVIGEANLRGRAIDNKIAVLDARTLSVLRQIDLDGTSPSIRTSVAQPADIAFSPDGSRAYIAAFGTLSVQVVETETGRKLNRISVGAGPRGLAIDGRAGILYALARIDQKISAIRLDTGALIARVPVGYDPTPRQIREGRFFLYSALRSSTGKFSCAGCHAEGHFDNLVWDLGTPQDPTGPMFTQSLRGLKDMSPFHWRGEKPDLASFNPAFSSLLGGHPLPPGSLRKFTAFLESIVYPPNPAQRPDRSLDAAASAGLEAFSRPATTAGVFSCRGCHSLEIPSGDPAYGTNRQVLGSPEDPKRSLKVPQLRGLAVKAALDHDGADRSIESFLQQPVFTLTDQERSDVAVFLRRFESETMPAVGVQATLDAPDCSETGTVATVHMLMDRASREIRPGAGIAEIDVQATGLLRDPAGVVRPAGLLYRPELAAWTTDRTGEAPLTFANIQALACSGGATLTFTGVPAGSGIRAVDRDHDGLTTGQEEEFGSDPADPDEDGDGLLDGQEALYGTSPRLADTDLDGAPDRDEIVDGTDPLDRQSFLKLLSVELTPDGVAMTWGSPLGTRVRVEATDLSLAAPPDDPTGLSWRLLFVTPEPETESPWGTGSWTDSETVPGKTLRLYRLAVEPPASS